MGHENATTHMPACTFGIKQDLPALDSGWQTFPGHYLLYASSGTFTLEAGDRRWLLPPQRAAWVAADSLIRIRALAPITSNSILFARGSIQPPNFTCRVFAVTPLAREMIAYAMRWGIDREPEDKVADQFFAAVAIVCLELADTPEQFWLPQARSEELNHAMDYIAAHLDSKLSVVEISRAISVSPRTLARLFANEVHLPCSQFIRRMRMLRAMELLADCDMPITEVAYTIGFESISAFNHAFHSFTQETPSQYRKRFLPR